MWAAGVSECGNPHHPDPDQPLSRGDPGIIARLEIPVE
jgi:hypothetical protein